MGNCVCKEKKADAPHRESPEREARASIELRPGHSETRDKVSTNGNNTMAKVKETDVDGHVDTQDPLDSSAHSPVDSSQCTAQCLAGR